MSAQWKVGAAIAPFPVAAGTPMAGYLARVGPAAGVHDEPTIGAMALEAGGKSLAIVTADIAGVDAALVDEVASAAGLDRPALALCASHTHSGPAGVTARLHPADEDRSDPVLRANFVAVCAAAIAEAKRRLEPADLLFGSTETTGLAASRNNPDGPFDSRLSVLTARRSDGEVSAVLTHFACHPTILGAENRCISADFPGALRRELRQTLGRDGRDPIVLFANGAAGDVSTRFTRSSQDFDEVGRVGAELAQADIAALKDAHPLDGSVAYGRQHVPLPPRPLAQPLCDAHAGLMPHPNSAAERRKLETRAQGATLLARLVEAGEDAIPPSLDIEVWTLGGLALVVIPGELFTSLGARIAAASTNPVLVLGYANGYAGYLADESSHVAGTYEALASPFAPGAGERVADAAIELIARVRAESSTGSERA